MHGRTRIPHHAHAGGCAPVCAPLLHNVPAQAALGAGGVVDGLSAGKGYVDMSTVDEATSGEIAAAVAAKGGRFLEVCTCWQHLHTWSSTCS